MEPSNKVRLMSLFQSSLALVILVISLVFHPENGFAADLPDDYLPQIQMLEIISSPTNRTTTVNLWKERNTDVVIGEDTGSASRILMKCNATYPVQWVYLGDGRPEFTTFTNVKWQEDPNVPLSFEAEASLGLLGFQGVLREEDTGNYTCRSIQEPIVHSYYYIYVPGNDLFVAANGTNITYSAQDRFLRLPCGVSHPKISSSMCKRGKNDSLSCPVSGASGFNSKGGFLVNLKKQRSPSGTYVCTANYKGTIRTVEHHVMRDDEKPKEPAPAPAPPTFQTKPGKNLCDPSPCGKQAECTVINGRAVCYCTRFLNGSPYECTPGKCRSSKECPDGTFCRQGQCTTDPCNPSPCGKGGECTQFRGRSKCSCQKGYTGLPPSCVKSCSQNEDCMENEACIKAICQSPCPGPCGQNAECRVLINDSRRTAQCSCPSGLLGDPLKNCYKLNSTTPGPWNNCPPGYVGFPPACQRKECNSHLDCQFGRKCMKGICDKGDVPACPGKCGVNAECVKSPTTSDPVCICPSSMTGDPTRQCYNLNGTPTTYLTPTSWGDPCKPNPCQGPAECHVIHGNRTCVCPPGFAGDPSNCFPITVPAFPSSSSTSGGHIFCRYDAECKAGGRCIEGHCIDPCNGICGYNAVCESSYQHRTYRSIFTTGKLLRSQQQPDNVCVCPPGHEGNPYVSCVPIRNSPPPPPPPALPSATTSAASVCFPNPCARFADCTPVNNAPDCRCQPGFEGNPYQDCRESIFSPSPSGDRTPMPYPTRDRGTPVSPTELDHQGHSWGHHTGSIDTSRDPPVPPPASLPPGRDYYESVGGSRFSSRPPPPPMHSDSPYPVAPSTIYDNDHIDRTGEAVFPSHYPTSVHVGDTPTPKTLDPPMSPLDPLAPPRNDQDECSFKNPYADYDMESCGVGHRCERDFRGVKRCVCISPFDCTGPTSIYAGNQCQSARDCLLSDHICMNGTCRNPCSPEFSPCAGIAFSECRVIEGNVLCTCRRGYVGSPMANGLPCRPKHGTTVDNENKVKLIRGGYHNGTGEYVIIISHSSRNISSSTTNATDFDGDNDSIIYDDGGDDDDIFRNSVTSGSGRTTVRHHRRHNNRIAGTSDDKIKGAHCGFGSGHICDEKSYCMTILDVPQCVCKLNYRGVYPNCKPQCEKNEDCLSDNMVCVNKQCLRTARVSKLGGMEIFKTRMKVK